LELICVALAQQIQTTRDDCFIEEAFLLFSSLSCDFSFVVYLGKKKAGRCWSFRLWIARK
jgi:hypothetical protein